MSRNQIVTVIKIIAAMLIALVIAFLLPTNPRSTFLFIAKLQRNFSESISKKVASLRLATTPLSAMKQINKGVYAKEDKELGTVYIKVTKDAERTEQILESNGQKIKIIYIK